MSVDSAPQVSTPGSAYPPRDETLVPAQGRQPLSPAGASYTGVVIAVVLLAAAVVLVRDAIIAQGWIGGSQLTPPAIGWIDGLTYQSWMLAAGIASVVIGLIFLYIAVKPRRKTAVNLEASSSMFVSPTDIARIASATAETVPGVQTARSEATRKKVKVKLTVSGPESVDSTVTQAIQDALTPLGRTPKVVVRSKAGVES